MLKNYKKILTLALVFTSLSVFAGSLYAAGPVTHAFLAHYWLQKCGMHLSPQEKRAFIIGTLYPDIRYPAQLSRESTHESNISLLVIRDAASAFDAGKKFHAWVDDAREYSMTPEYTQELFKLLSGIPSRGTFLKFIEDEVLIRALKLGYPELLKSFKADLLNYYPQERAYNVSQETVHDWHKLLIEHFTYAPTEIFALLSRENKPYGVASAEFVKLWAKALPKYSAEPVFQEHVRKLLVYLFELMRACDATVTYTYTKKNI